jgi:hypothetical protein
MKRKAGNILPVYKCHDEVEAGYHITASFLLHGGTGPE